MSPRCIYCPTETTGDEGRAHVLPEAIVANDLTLPSGACCDACNNYLGKLDSALASHPIVSLYVQFLGLPGKGGRLRRRLGNVGRDPEGAYVAIPVKDPEFEEDEEGVRTWTATPRIAPAQDSVEFARALHRLAFEAMVAVHGPEPALQEAFGPVRDFIRRPDRGERWPYVSWAPALTPVEEEVEIVTLSDAPGHTVGIQLFNLRFVVDLLRTGELEEYAEEVLPDSAHYGFPELESEPPGDREWRLRIWLDEDAARDAWSGDDE